LRHQLDDAPVHDLDIVELVDHAADELPSHKA